MKSNINENPENANLKGQNIYLPFLIILLFSIGTIIIWQIPGGKLILYPFTLLGTWFHEMGHGLTAMLLGGSFIKLEIFSDGSGLAVHTTDLILGGLGQAGVSIGGPLAPAIAGAIFISISKNKKTSSIVLFIFALFILVSVVFWVRSLTGLIVLIAFFTLLFIISIKGTVKIQQIILQFIGVQAFASTYQGIGYFFSSGATVAGSFHKSDTQVIADNLLLPYWFWGGIICLISFILAFISIRYLLSNDRKNITAFVNSKELK